MVTLYLGYTQPIDNAFVFFFLAALSSSHVSVSFRQCRIYNRKKEKNQTKYSSRQRIKKISWIFSDRESH